MARLPVAMRFAFAAAVLATVMSGSLCAQSRQPMTETSGAAQLVSFKGQVSVLRGSDPWALNVGDYVQPMQVIVTGSNGSAVFQIADGSTFEVYPKSRVVFRANRGDWRDLLELMLGKVRVQIEHPGGAPNPNKVHTPTAVISVRGTTFDVEYDADANATRVLDEEGSVEVARALRLDDKKILNANEGIVVYKNDPLARSVDKGDLLKRIIRGVADAATQEAINGRAGSPSVAGTSSTGAAAGGTGAGDKNNNGSAPPPPPPPPPSK